MKVEDRDSDGIDSPEERSFAQRVLAALIHPDCPVVVLEFEAKKLAYHITKRIKRNVPKQVYYANKGQRE